MKAARFLGPGRIEVMDIPAPACGTGEIVIRVHRAGICGTDLRIFRGEKAVTPPITPGHEFSGTVADIGRSVTGLQTGTRVTVEPIIPCGECYCCRAGRENICLTRPTIGYQHDGAFAEYVRIPADAIRMGNVVPVPETLGLDAACYAEPLAACINGIGKLSLQGAERLWVIGDGPIGLTHVQLARCNGVEDIFLSGTRDDRLAAGMEEGARWTFNVTSGGDPVQWISDLTGGEGVDAAIVATNVPETVPQATSSLRKGGRLLLFAGYPPRTRLPFDLSEIHYREYRILGASGHAARDVRSAIELMASGRFDALSLITHHLPLDSIVEGLEMKENFIGLKHVIDLK
jgi:L-iditol 2-dehydrogenase